MAAPPTLDDLRNEYLTLFADCQVKDDKVADVRRVMNQIVASRATYERATATIAMPWWFLGIIHSLEGDLNFRTHLHNGDPLTARTVHVPAGRPVAKPRAHPDQDPSNDNPYSWEESAEDSIRFEHLDTWADWSLAGSLFKMEAYNGFGYRTAHPDVLSPYLWSFTNKYTKGKFVADGVFNADTVSAQVGGAAILRMLVDGGTVALNDYNQFIAKRGLNRVIDFTNGVIGFTGFTVPRIPN